MYKELSLAKIKQEAKDLKKKEPKLTHTEALNKVAQKYGYGKYEILKAKFCEPYTKVNTTEIELKKVLDNVLTHVNFKTALQRLKNKHIAIIGGVRAGKSTLLLQEHKNLDKKDTLFLYSQAKNSFNGHPNYIEEESYKKYFKEEMPIFKNATFKTKKSTGIDFEKYNTIVMDESFNILKNKKLLSDLMKIIAKNSKTVIITFQSKEDAKALGFSLKHIQDIRDDNPRSTPLDLYEFDVGGAGMSYLKTI